MSNIGHAVQTLASFLFVLGVLVTIHEMGHYWAARWCRVGVEAFSLGFGPTLKSWVDRRGTVWKVSLLPLGGYVKMYGMTPTAQAEAEAAGEVFRPQDAYCAKPVHQRALIAAAGPLANFALAIVLFAALFASVGRQVQLPVVGEIVENSAAAQAGLKIGDDIVAVDGMPIATFTELRDVVVASPDHDLMLTVHRDTADLKLRVHVHAVGSGPLRTGLLGVRSGRSTMETMGPGRALISGVTETWTMLADTVTGLVGIVANGQGAGELGGPIMIAQMSGKVAQLGFANLIMFIGVLSVNLGLVNLLPIPVLDGGHLMFYAAEALRGRPVPARAQEYGYRVGIAIIACVFVMVSWNDLVRDGAIHWVTHLAG
jgi:regulator of sigma E protease